MSGSGREKDLRTDSNNDGKLDFWKLRSGDVNVEVRHDSEGAHLKIQDYKQNLQVDALDKGNGVQVKSIVQMSSPGSVLSPTSPRQNEASYKCPTLVNNKLQAFSDQINLKELRGKAEKIWSESCSSLHDFDEIKDLVSDSLAKLLKLDTNKKNPLLSCLENSRTNANEDEKKRIDIWLLEIKSTVVDFYDGKLPAATFKCETAESDGISPGAPAPEIKMLFKDGKGFSPVAKIQGGLTAAILSNAGIPAEESVKLSKFCLAGDFEKASQALCALAGRGKSALSMVSDGAMAQTARQETVSAVNRKLAETKVNIPSAEDASPRALAAIERTQGAEAAASVARSQSSGLMNAANTIMGAVNAPAVAQSRGLASTTSPSRADKVVFGNSVVGKRIPAAGKAGGDEYVAEEYLVNNKQQAPTQQRAGANARMPATVGGVKVANKANSNQPTEETERDSSSGAGPELGQVASGSSGTRLSSRSSENIQPQNVSQRSGNSASSSESESVRDTVTFLSGANYTDVRNKLKDTKFLKFLEENSITITNRSGIVRGAPRGKMVFFDTGDRLVRQK